MTDVATLTGNTSSHSADVEMLKARAVAAKEAVVDLGSGAKTYASHRYADAKVKASEWVDTAKEKASAANDNVVDFVQRRPFTAIGIAVGIGFVAGLILKRR